MLTEWHKLIDLTRLTATFSSNLLAFKLHSVGCSGCLWLSRHDLDSADPLIFLAVHNVCHVPLQDVNLFLGSSDVSYQDELVLMFLGLKINLDPVDELKLTLAHGLSGNFNLVLEGQLVTFLHEGFDRGVDLSAWEETTGGPFFGSLGSHGFSSSSGQFLALEKILNVDVESSPGWVADERKIALLVHQNAERDLLYTEELHSLAILGPDVAVVKLCQRLFFNICS